MEIFPKFDSRHWVSGQKALALLAVHITIMQSIKKKWFDSISFVYKNSTYVFTFTGTIVIFNPHSLDLSTSSEVVVSYLTQSACLCVSALKWCHDLNKSVISFSAVHNQITCSPGKRRLCYLCFIINLYYLPR